MPKQDDPLKTNNRNYKMVNLTQLKCHIKFETSRKYKYNLLRMCRTPGEVFQQITIRRCTKHAEQLVKSGAKQTIERCCKPKQAQHNCPDNNAA